MINLHRAGDWGIGGLGTGDWGIGKLGTGYWGIRKLGIGNWDIRELGILSPISKYPNNQPRTIWFWASPQYPSHQISLG